MKLYTLPPEGFSSKSEEKIFWERAIEGYRGSKLRRIEFCERNGLKLSSFKRWVTQLNRELTKAAVCSEGLNFVQVKIGEAKEVSVNEKLSEATKFEVELSSGDKVRLPLSKDVLVMTINLLKRQGC